MIATTALVALGVPMAQATTFDFGLVYDINTQAQFNTVFGTGTPGFTTPGLYEETNTTTKTVANVGTNSSTAPALLTMYAQNSSPSAQLAFTNFGTNPSAIFPGFPLSGSTWQYVQTLSTTNASFGYEVGGNATQFALNSIGLANLQSCQCSTSVEIEGFLNGQLVANQTVGIPGNVVGGNGNPGVPASVEIFTLAGFGDVDSVKLLPLGANVNVNDITISPVAATPLPAALPLFATALGGLGLLGWRRKRKAQAA
jgi:hypothetical protein